MLAPIAWRTPPEHYGPWEQVASVLTEGLVARGIDVTLFAAGTSRTAGTLDWVCAEPYAEHPEMDGRIWEAMHTARALARSAEFDLIHNHLDWLPLAFSHFSAAPMITTIHGFSRPAILPAYRAARSHFVAISDADRVPDLPYLDTIHHGVDLATLPFSSVGGDDLVVLGRIHPDKGTADAIRIGRRSGRRLLIAGIIQDREYFDSAVRPHLDGDRVVYLGSIGPQQRAELLGAAMALLHPIHFDEPFGLSVVEAMVCGTPVIAYPRGSMPEIIDVGHTGFLVPGVDEAVAAVEQVAQLDRHRCHTIAAHRFSADRMVSNYLSVYDQVLRGGG